MEAKQLANGDYIIFQVPIMHWAFVSCLTGILGIGFWRDAPLWFQLFLGFLLLVLLIKNTKFKLSTCISSTDRKIYHRAMGIFGVKQREVPFNQVINVDCQVERLGKYRRTPHITLTIEALDNKSGSKAYFEVLVTARSDKAQAVADKISEMLSSSLPPEVPEAATVPPWFREEAVKIIVKLAQLHNSETCFFVTLEELDESRRTAMEKKVSFPKNERILIFLDTTKSRDGERGLALGCGGLYWRNGFLTETTRSWISWEEFIEAELNLDPNDADIWIFETMQIGLKEKEQQQTVYELFLAIQTELKKIRDHQV